MKRSILALSLLSLIPISVAAQAINVDRTNAAAAPARGLTATESATEKLPADAATVTVRIMSSSATAPTQAQLQQVADAFVKAGFAPTNVAKQTAVNVTGANVSMSTVTATAEHPSSDLLKQAVEAATSAANLSEFPFFASSIQLRANNCTDALNRARVEAIAKTRAKAMTIAREIGVQLGAIQALNDNERLNPDGSCTTQLGMGPGSAEFMQGRPTALSDYTSVIVTSTVTITYGIK